MSLTRVFKFEADDLAANRRGELTAHREKRLHDYHESILRNHWQSGIGISLVLAVGTVIAFLAGNHELAGIGVWLTPMMAGVFILSLPLNNLTSRRLLKGEIRMAEGEAKLTTDKSRTTTLYRVRLGKKQFYVSKGQYEAFRKEQSYRLYYIDGIPYFILSVELL